MQRLSEKILTLSSFQIDEVACLRFDSRLANMPAQEFVSQFFVKQLKVKHVVVGDDFCFGKARQGNAGLLTSMGERLGFSVQQVETVMMSNERVSSSRVRNELKQGNCYQAKLLLGRYYRVVSRVVYGDQRGRQWGFQRIYRCFVTSRHCKVFMRLGCKEQTLPHWVLLVLVFVLCFV